MRGTDQVHARRGPLVWLAAAILALLVLGGFGASTVAWGAEARDGGRLLPGTTIAGIDLGQATPEDAVTALSALVDDRLERTVEVSYHEHRYPVSARDLGATADLDAVVTDAVTRASDLDFTDLVRVRWSAPATG